MTTSFPKNFWFNPIHFLAFGFGTGLSPKAPGTFGTLAALPFLYVMASMSLTEYSIALIAISLVGIPICHIASKNLKVHDHPGIVWDEIAGYLITLWAIPLNPETIVLGFALFRFFDILKPQPIAWCDEKVSGGFGIMIDDIIAGVYACISLHILYHLWLKSPVVS
jgi:phosphatidylglycerophosphatase A